MDKETLKALPEEEQCLQLLMAGVKPFKFIEDGEEVEMYLKDAEGNYYGQPIEKHG